MDIRVILILTAEALFALWLLYKAGLLKDRRYVFAAVLLGVGVWQLWAAGACLLDYETLDYKDFLSQWVQYFRDNGGFAALSRQIGNYNIPYLYFLALFSYSGIDDLYLIKLLSIFFDVLLAWGCALLLGRFTDSAPRRRALFAHGLSQRRALGTVRQQLCRLCRAGDIPCALRPA